MDRARLQAKSLDEPDERRELPGVVVEMVRVGDLFASRSTTAPGWRWSTDLGPIVRTASCQIAHRGIVLSGHMRIEMDDGEILDLVAGQVAVVPAGHDAAVIGDEPVVMIDISSAEAEFGQPAAGDRVLSTLLFTDIVGSTTIAEQLGDQRWKGVLAVHDRILADIVHRYRGHIVQTTGDGLFARFDGAARGLRAALAMRSDVSALDLAIRIGIHTGEIELQGDDTRGVAIHEAARIMALAGAGEILVSDLTRQLATGADLTFEDRGVIALRGVVEPRHVYLLEPAASHL